MDALTNGAMTLPPVPKLPPVDATIDPILYERFFEMFRGYEDTLGKWFGLSVADMKQLVKDPEFYAKLAMWQPTFPNYEPFVREWPTLATWPNLVHAWLTPNDLPLSDGWRLLVSKCRFWMPESDGSPECGYVDPSYGVIGDMRHLEVRSVVWNKLVFRQLFEQENLSATFRFYFFWLAVAFLYVYKIFPDTSALYAPAHWIYS